MQAVASAFNRFTGFFNEVFGNHGVEIRGIPYNLKVIFDPKEWIKLVNQHDIKKAASTVNLAIGPLNRIAGQYHIETGQIEVDVLEIAAARVSDGDPNKLDREVTEVLAHEFRHACQRENHSVIGMKWDQWAMFFGFKIFLILFWLMPIYYGASTLVFRMSNWWSIPLGILTAIAAWISFRILWTLSSIAAYRWSWHERDARKFAREAVNDPAWRNIIHVEQVALSDDQIRQAMLEQMLNELHHQFGSLMQRR